MASITDVPEHRIRPIYDALDSGSPRQALGLCQKALKKQPNGLILKSLQALALDRLGREDEALEICDEVKKAGPTDEAVLQGVMMVWRGCGKHKEIIEAYDTAFTKQPRNEELGNHFFMALVRAGGEYARMQQTAMKLQKQFKSPRYLFWTIMTIWLQAKQTTDEQKKKLLTTLAERMIVKAGEEGKMTDYESLLLYLDILTTQGKHAEALSLLLSPLGKLCKLPVDHSRHLITLHAQLHHWSEAISLSRDILRSNPDDWIAWESYITGVVNTGEDGRAFVREIQEQVVRDEGRVRGPWLAGLELEKRLTSMKNKQNGEEAIGINRGGEAGVTPEMIIDFYTRFNGLTSCYDDLRPYLDLPPHHQSQVIQHFTSLISPNEITVKTLRPALNAEKILFYYSTLAALDEQAAMTNIKRYMEKYKETIPLGEGQDPRSLHPGDDYVMLAAYTLLYLQQQTNETTTRQPIYQQHHLLSTLLTLELALHFSPSAHPLKLLLFPLYTTLAVSPRLLSLANSLSIKQIQHDTLSYLSTDHLESTSTSLDALRAFYTTTGIYESNHRETPEMKAMCWKWGTWSQVDGFDAFEARLEKSLQRVVTKTQIERVRALDCFGDVEGLTHVLGDSSAGDETAWSDNRDVDVMVKLADMNAGELVFGKNAYPRERKGWLMLHGCMRDVLLLLCDHEASRIHTEEVMGKLNAVETEGKEMGCDEDETYVARFLATVLRIVMTDQQNTSDEKEQKITKLFNDIDDRIRTTVQPSPLNTFTHLTHTLELLHILHLLCSNIHARTNPNPPKAKSKSKSKSATPHHHPYRAKTTTALQALLNRLDSLPREMEVSVEVPQWLKGFEKMGRVKADVETWIRDAWGARVREVKEWVEKALKAV
ncbi:N-alpha-acetyltransferase 25, NatB auxiliary subunit [Gaertneriomyces sp. JEL0708]|nr:N-alpha-acetyltransferase 25, NatB auxiliary subunit [Gaertneriomyces sp. JEL0708]